MAEKNLFLRHSFAAHGVKVLLELGEAIRGSPGPKKLKAVRRFLCMVCFYGRFIERFPQISETFHLLKRKNVSFLCGDDYQTALTMPYQRPPHCRSGIPLVTLLWFAI